ncbi:MAG: DUF1576 domain-containing protein [Clostridiales bacterium]|nr:DUF1576 domain-containing protein [Clostridiales bacterium]
MWISNDKKVKTAASKDLGRFANKSNTILNLYMLSLSVYFCAFSLIAFFTIDKTDFIDNYLKLLLSPSKLVTDYFALGGLTCTLFNAGICGLFSNFIIFISKTKPNATTFAGYLLVVAHCFYGLNIINMIPSILGVILYCKVKKRAFSENVHIALFSTALGPFTSDFLFRYAFNIAKDSTEAIIVGAVLAIILGLATGFLVPALIKGTTGMHRGFNMYKAGLALGLLGVFLHSFFYTSLGFDTPPVITIDNPEYYAMPFAYRDFMNVFFVILFVFTLILGYLLNGKSMRGYKALLKSTGYGTDFFDKFKMPVCLINFAVYGVCIILYLNLIMLLPQLFDFLPKGVGFTGATVGVIFAALTFSADGQQPRTVAPIVLGYVLLSAVVIVFSLCFNRAVPWTLSTQCYINGLAFATGLCPFAGKYGWKVGVIAGFLSAVICASTAAMHGGFVLYNGGFTAGLTALVVLPILDFYDIKPKFDDDRE